MIKGNRMKKLTVLLTVLLIAFLILPSAIAEGGCVVAFGHTWPGGMSGAGVKNLKPVSGYYCIRNG